jgi:iron complex transport system ATP-binding protein
MKLSIINGGFGYTDTYLFKNINLTVGDHEILAILGPNGIGKTTLLKCMMNMLSWKEGKALLNNVDLSVLPRKEFWKKVAYVPQVKSSAFHISAREMVLLGRSAHIPMFSQPKQNDEEITDRVMKTLKISHLADRSCRTLSGGELQLVLIARALAAEPEILIMDEPESNLDYYNQLLILNRIQELSQTISCVINTHYPEHALRISHHALLFTGKSKSIYGKTDEIITEKNLRDAFHVNVMIGDIPGTTSTIGTPRFILPLSIRE